MVLPGDQDPGWHRPENVAFVEETGYLVLQLDPGQFGFAAREVRYRRRIFQPKSELHITVISREAAEVVKDFLTAFPTDAGRVRELIHETRWRFRKLDKFYHVVEAPGVETIIQMVEIDRLSEIFQALSDGVGRALALPPTHVTLYTRGTEKGIGLPDRETFEELVRARIQPEEVALAGDRRPTAPPAGGEDQGLV